MRILLLIAIAAFLLFGAAPDRAMAMPMDHGTDCVACAVEHDMAAGHGTCPHMTACGLAMLPELQGLLSAVTLAETPFALPRVVEMQDVSPPCDLPPPRG